jgi:hypothetical protein
MNQRESRLAAAMPCIPGHAMSCCAAMSQHGSCRAMLCHAVPCCAMLCHAVPCCAMLCHAVSQQCSTGCHVGRCHAVSCCAARRAVICCAMLCCASQGEKPPEPDERTLREPDVAAGVMELQQLGLVGLLMQQHGVGVSRGA